MKTNSTAQFYIRFKWDNMLINKYINILYDFDGTLVDTAPDIVDCLTKAYQIALDRELIIERNIVGPPLLKMIDKLTPGLKEAELKALVRTFRKLYDNNDFAKTRLFPGTKKTLEHFQNSGLKQFIVTNKPSFVTNLLINKFKISYFQEVVNHNFFLGRDLSKSEMVKYLIQKYQMTKARTLLVGDTASDIQAAKENGLASVGILAGYDPEATIRASQPDYLFKSMTVFYNDFVIKTERAK